MGLRLKSHIKVYFYPIYEQKLQLTSQTITTKSPSLPDLVQSTASLLTGNGLIEQITHATGLYCVGSTNVFAYTGSGTVNSWYAAGSYTIISSTPNSVNIKWNPAGTRFSSRFSGNVNL